MSKSCPQKDWCNTNHQIIETTFVWTIDNFSKCDQKTGQSLESPIFNAKEDVKTIWSLLLFPNGNKDDKEYISLFLKMKSSDRIEVETDGELSLIDHKNVTIERHRYANIFKPSSDWGWSKFFRRSLLEYHKNDLLPNDRLTIICKVSYLSSCKITSGTGPTYLKRKRTLIDDMNALYCNKTDTDFEFVVKKRRFSAHKMILKARSPVFAAMFEHPMIESLQNKANIEDIDIKVFERLLHFIYTDEVIIDNINTFIGLLFAAEKYNLEKLKAICVEYIGSNLTVDTVCDVLILADSLSAEELKKKAILFINNNFNKVAKTKKWKNILDRSDLIGLI